MEFESKFIHNDYEPPCDRGDCFACVNRRCQILTSNDFGKRECPFYKPEKGDEGI